MNLDYILISFCLFFCFLNLFLDFFIGLFLVRFQQSISRSLEEIKQSTQYFDLKREEKEIPTKGKTWDQKYEEELREVAERISKNSEL